MSSRSRRVAAKVWKPGDVAWVQYKAGPARGTLDKRLGETTWNVSFDDGEETQIPERLLLREQPMEDESSSDDDSYDDDAPVRFLVVALFFRRRLAEQQALGYLRLFAVVEAHVPSHLSEALVQRAPGRSGLVLHPGNVSSLPGLRSDAPAPAAHREMQSLAD